METFDAGAATIKIFPKHDLELFEIELGLFKP